MTPRLWRYLAQPPTPHPLYRRIVSRDAVLWPTPLRWPQTVPRWLPLAVIIAVIALIQPGALVLLPVFIPIGALLLLLAMPFLLPVALTGVGALWAAAISRAILRAQAGGIYDLTALSPAGKLAAHWAIASGTLYRGELLAAITSSARIVVLVGAGVLIFLTGATLALLLVAGYRPEMLVAARTLVDGWALLTAFYVHYVQSVVLSALVGMLLTALELSSPRDTPVAAAGLYLALQGGFYAICAVLYVIARPLLLADPPLIHPLPYLLLPLLTLAGFYGLRELLIGWLWGQIEARLHHDRRGLDLLQQIALG